MDNSLITVYVHFIMHVLDDKSAMFVTQAYTKIVKMYQEEMEKQRKKDEEERKRHREMVQRQKRMLEAAFNGDNDEILTILKEVNHAITALHYEFQLAIVIIYHFTNVVKLFICSKIPC